MITVYNNTVKNDDWIKSLPPSKAERLIFKVLDLEYSGKLEATKGGKGSGNWGHAGRPGHRGGSMPGSFGFGREADLDKTVARLKAAATRRGTKLRDALTAELEADEGYVKLRDMLRKHRANLVKAQKAYDGIRQQDLAFSQKINDANKEVDALFDQYMGANKKMGEIQDQIEPLKHKRIMTDGPMTKKEKALKAEYDKYSVIADAYHGEWYKKYHEREALNDAHHALFQTQEYNDIREALDKARKDYQDTFMAGDSAVARAMEITEKYRKKFVDDKIGGKLSEFKDANKAELEEKLGQMEKLVIQRSEFMKQRHENNLGAALSEEERAVVDAQMALKPEIARLSHNGQAIYEISQAMRESFLNAPIPGNVVASGERGQRADASLGTGYFNKIVPQNPLMTAPVVFGKTDPGDAYGGIRAYATGGRVYFPDAGQFLTTATHELGHILEEADPFVGHAAVRFLKSRTNGKTPEKLRDITGNKGYLEEEVAVKDGFIDPYMGKIYHGDYATEIFSMGTQKFADNGEALRLAKEDPEYFNFIYSTLRI